MGGLEAYHAKTAGGGAELLRDPSNERAALFTAKMLINEERLAAHVGAPDLVPHEVFRRILPARWTRLDFQTVVWIEEDQIGVRKAAESSHSERMSLVTVVGNQSVYADCPGEQVMLTDAVKVTSIRYCGYETIEKLRIVQSPFAWLRQI